jgi:hypothetical protein
MLHRIDAFLDRHVLPYPVKFLTNRIVILITLALLVPLILMADHQVLVLLLNSYLNVMSVVVSSTVLLYSTLSEARDRNAALRREEIAREHEARIERRAQEDHETIAKIQTHVDKLHQEVIDHFNVSLDNILNLMLAQLAKVQSEDRTHIEEAHRAILASADAHQSELAELASMVETMRKKLAEQSSRPNATGG